MTMLDLSQLNCDGCPAEHMLDIDRIRRVEELRLDALSNLESEPRWILLCESIPADRFLYDKDADYTHRGLRYKLRNELVPGQDDDSLFRYLEANRVWICDAALCPLHRLRSNRDKRLAATICLQRHTSRYLGDHPGARLVAVMPERRGFLKRQLPDIASRVVARFSFSDLDGLKELLAG